MILTTHPRFTTLSEALSYRRALMAQDDAPDCFSDHALIARSRRQATRIMVAASNATTRIIRRATV